MSPISPAAAAPSPRLSRWRNQRLSAPYTPSGTRIPATRFGAPLTTVSLRSPRSTVTSTSRSALGCGWISATRPTTMPSHASPTVSMEATSVPAMVSRCASSAGGRSTATYSLSQLNGTFIASL